MKKIFVLVLVFMTLVMGTAFAEKDKYKNDDYDFKSVKTMLIASATGPSATASENYYPAAAPTDKVTTLVREDLEKRGVSLISGYAGISQRKNKTAPVCLAITVYKMGYDKSWKAPWDETVTENEKKVAKDENGNDVIVTEPVQKVVHHNGEWQYHCYADVGFKVTDKNNKVIYSVRDTRDRDGQDYDGMLGRICKDFSKDVTKN
jgi:hypothetical protein